MIRKTRLILSQAITRIVWEVYGKRRQASPRVPVLVYHRVLPDLVEDENEPLYTVLPEQFDAHLALLRREGFSSFTLPEFADLVRGRRPPLNRAVVITFDDGLADTYAIAWPLAQKYGIKLNLFVCTGLIGRSRPVIMTQSGYFTYYGASREPWYYEPHVQRFSHLWRPLSWLELREMSQAGVYLGFHGHTHRNPAFLSAADLEKDITEGMEVFRKELGYRPEYFALPYGGHEPNLPETAAFLEKLGMSFIFTTMWGRARVPSHNRIFPRISIYQQDSLETFRRKLLGACDWVGAAEQLLHKAKRLLGNK